MTQPPPPVTESDLLDAIPDEVRRKQISDYIKHLETAASASKDATGFCTVMKQMHVDMFKGFDVQERMEYLLKVVSPYDGCEDPKSWTSRLERERENCPISMKIFLNQVHRFFNPSDNEDVTAWFRLRKHPLSRKLGEIAAIEDEVVREAEYERAWRELKDGLNMLFDRLQTQADKELDNVVFDPKGKYVTFVYYIAKRKRIMDPSVSDQRIIRAAISKLPYLTRAHLYEQQSLDGFIARLEECRFSLVKDFAAQQLQQQPSLQQGLIMRDDQSNNIQPRPPETSHPLQPIIDSHPLQQCLQQGTFPSDTPRSSPIINDTPSRVILFMDVDCFEVQVWAKQKCMDQESVPIIVVNDSDMMLSINYKARALGIQKMKGRADVVALQNCHPELKIIRAELKRGLTDTLLLRKESDKILDAIRSHDHPLFQGRKPVVERVNNDEIYIDCTEVIENLECPPPTSCRIKGLASNLNRGWMRFLENPCETDDPRIVFEDSEKLWSKRMIRESVEKDYGNSVLYDYTNNSLLMTGALLARAFHREIWRKSGYRVSFGVADSKMLAKIACEENKPNAITALTNRGCLRVLKALDFRKLPGFRSEKGEKLCKLAQKVFGLDLVTLEDVRRCSREVLEQLLALMRYRDPKEATASLRQKAYGICDESVISKCNNDSIQRSLPLSGINSTHSWQQLQIRIEDLAAVFYEELEYRAQRYKETPAVIVVKTELKTGGMRAVGSFRNALEGLRSLPTVLGLQGLIEQYVSQAHLNFRDVFRIRITASKFIPAPVPSQGCSTLLTN